MFRFLVLTAVTGVSVLRVNCTTAATVAMAMRAADFEVYGRVQGVFFRKFTKEQAQKLGLRGWCKNTDEGTVLGHMQGPPDKIETMMQWLKTTGSPSSRIEKAEFRNQKEITEYSFDNFSIVKD
ncbi:acylphosphatase-2 isoform X1 [Amyelois transitella]|uniref:acylphosphatase-2 isoform X1 n=2 Tax=Amyelois transitella TaxID=680683 RepID=UPI00298FADB6|nr:acylphosphatase-2 isoform X1 [Amyelois transitella]